MERSNVIIVNKPLGKTPLQTLDQLRLDRPELSRQKLAYAGRLDPMAEGALLVLVGEGCKKREEYENLNKIYEFKALIGAATDTYDLMGKLVSTTEQVPSTTPSNDQVHQFMQKYTGTFSQAYPPFSSVRINGKPLYFWARENKLSEIEIPTKTVTITQWEQLSSGTISATTLLNYITSTVGSIEGKFRQSEIIQHWTDYLTRVISINFPLFSFRVHCSSGTYVRSLVHELGEFLHVPTTTYSIKRTKVGEFNCPDNSPSAEKSR